MALVLGLREPSRILSRTLASGCRMASVVVRHGKWALRARAAIRAYTILLVGLTFGCDAFDTDRRPYTPFAVASGAGAISPEPSPTPAPELVPPPAVTSGVLEAPARANTWQLAGRVLEAPEGLIFRLGMVGAFAKAAPGDVLAWLVGAADNPVIGELWLFAESHPPRLIARAPTFLPTGPGCSHGARLSRSGPNSVTLDIKASCTGPLLPRSPERSVSVIAPLREQPIVVGFRLAAPAAGERLDLEISSADRDDDGRDDVELQVIFGTEGDSDVKVRFSWLDRPAGLSRDTTEPLASFTELAELESKRASNRKAAPEVQQRVATIRRLYGSLCADSGTARVFSDTGAALDCGKLTAVFEALTRASVEAAASLGNTASAYGELERHRWFPFGEHSQAARFERQLLGTLAERTVRRRVIKLVPLKTRPRPPDPTPRYSRLSFHADGSLLLLGSEGLVRAAPDGRFEYDAESEMDAWPTAVASRTGERLLGVSFPCDRSLVEWVRSTSVGQPLSPLLTDLASPRPGNCRSGSGFSAPKLTPLGWTEAGPSVFVGATRVGPLPPHPPMGSALSPNGRFSIVATEHGLLVGGGEKPALWVFDNPSLPTHLEECVVSNNAQAAACILQGNAYVVLPDPKSG